MKRLLLELTALIVALGFLGLLVVASGIVPVKASAGHWPVTRAFLSFAMRRSVETHAIGARVPQLDDPSLVLRGAGHYDRGCQPCHGAPGEPASLVARELTPHPPYLPHVVPLWEPAELFQIVRHGIKMTGMPAWPALDRTDEVWAVVAFLRRLPDLDSADYRRLARGDPADAPEATGPADPAQANPPESPGLERLAGPARDVVRTCAQCHGRDGLGRGVGAFPRIAGQSAAYLAAALEAYADGERHSGIMQPVAAPLDDGMVRDLALHYGGAVLAVLGEADDPTLLEEGERIAHEGIPRRKVPSCVDCHGPTDRPRNPFYPVLAGQYAEYLELQLRLFREERRGGSAYAHIMREAVHRLEPEEAEAVAAWYASLPWESRR